METLPITTVRTNEQNGHDRDFDNAPEHLRPYPVTPGHPEQVQCIDAGSGQLCYHMAIAG